MGANSLYHYTKIDSAKKIIASSALKLSVYPKINDPFDMNKDIIYNPQDDGDELYRAICADKDLHAIRPAFSPANIGSKKQILSSVKQALSGWSFREIVARTPFLCFSAKFNIPLMWGHYGDGCKGVVLEFRGGLIEKAEEVRYEEFEILPSVLNVERIIKMVLKGDRKELDKFGVHLLITKHQIWSYEEEHRLICSPDPAHFMPDQDGNRFFPFEMRNLIGIYFGFSAEESEVNAIKKQLVDLGINHIKLYRMVRKPGYFSAQHEEITP